MSSNSVIAAASQGDTTAPTAPGKPLATSVCQTTMTLSWAASTDNVGVTGYNIYRNGVLNQDVGLVLIKAITGLTAGNTAGWTVKAYDAGIGPTDSNLSDASPNTNVTQGVNVTLVTINLTGQGTGNDACSEVIGTTRYLTGGNSTFDNNEVVYTNSCGTIKLNGGGNFFSDDGFFFTISSTGVVGGIDTCAI